MTENLQNQKQEDDETEEVSAISPSNVVNKSNRMGFWYDVVMLFVISVDLLIILLDNVLMSSALMTVADWVSLGSWIQMYRDNYHEPLSALGGFFTVFLIAEILIRWVLAIINKTYYRWFFFPFVHWYEVLGCLPQFRALRLLRAIAIGRRLYKLGHRFLPEKWLDTAKFYYGILMEEVSDKVLLTAVDNVRTQLKNSSVVDSQALVKRTIDNNRENIESMILSMLRTELAPRLRKELMPKGEESPIAKHVGIAVSEAVAETPEINFVLRKIPIAGSMIESQLMGISQKVGYNLANSVNRRLLNDEVLDELFISIAHGISQIDTSNPALEALVADIINESLNTFESQVKIQQWQHSEYINKMHL